MSKKEIYTCNKCNYQYIREIKSKLELNKCDSCILNEIWNNLITEMAKALKLDIFLEWLNNKIINIGKKYKRS